MKAKVTIDCPGSKSITQRALLIAALSEAPSTIYGALACDDSRALTAVLSQLGAEIQWRGEQVDVKPPASLVERGVLVSDGAALDCGNAGTAMRFSACLSLLVEGTLQLDGDTRMRQRPLGPLLDALAALGVEATCALAAGCPPVLLRSGNRSTVADHRIEIDTSLSSQYASGLALVAPRLPRGLVLKLIGDQVSLPYLEMTARMIARAGVRAHFDASDTLAISPGRYEPPNQAQEVESDWSTASFLLAAAEILGGELSIPGLVPPEHSLQGDAIFSAFVERLSEGSAETFDLTDVPDLIAPLTALALFSSGKTTIRGAAHTRLKECDRIAVLATELSKIGAKIRERDDGLEIEPLQQGTVEGEPVQLDPANDHRMAMAFGLIGLRVPRLRVKDPDCVSKSFPRFWEVLGELQQALGSRRA